MEPPVCIVTESLICRFRLPAPDCERCVNRSDITCSIYCGHKSPGKYSGLKSLQTATSFQPWRPLSLVFFFCLFFLLHTKNHATYFHSDKLDFKTYFLKKKQISYCFRCYLVVVWFSHTLLTIFVLCINNLFKIIIIIY